MIFVIFFTLFHRSVYQHGHPAVAGNLASVDHTSYVLLVPLPASGMMELCHIYVTDTSPVIIQLWRLYRDLQLQLKQQYTHIPTTPGNNKVYTKLR